MAEAPGGEQQDSGKGKHKKVRAKKSSTHIDMTPMVDLAFLLLTFFMLTTTFSKPKTMEINMPVKDKPEVETKVNNAVTILLGDKDRIFWYFGEFKPAETQLEETNWSATGIRKILLEKNEKANDRIRELAKKLEKGQIADSTFKKERVEIQG